MALEEEFELGGVDDVNIDDCSRGAVFALVRVSIVLWEETDMMSLAHRDHGDLGSDTKALACS